MRYLQLRSTWKWSLSNLIALLRHQLFVYRDLWTWINGPFHPPLELETGQVALELGYGTNSSWTAAQRHRSDNDRKRASRQEFPPACWTADRFT